MMPRLLDLFCGAGGAAMGYYRAGFDEIVGVDIAPQKHYPFTFIQADAMDFPLTGYDLIHASPPCQDHMRSSGLRNKIHGTAYMLGETRKRLLMSDTFWVIENVPGAPMRVDYRLCGCMFGLPHLRRERWFESSWNGFTLTYSHYHYEAAYSIVGNHAPSWQRKRLGFTPTLQEWKEAMGIDWMNRKELSEAIPPAYTEFIGKQLLAMI